jgi:phosphoribosylanthranilate isomerase
MNRTRIKICGLTRLEDVAAAVVAGADALGFVCYAGSPRYVPPERLAVLARQAPAYVTPVLLFVDAQPEQIRVALDAVPHALLQLHGSETPEQCAALARPYVKAFAVSGGTALLDCEARFASAVALLADTPSAGHGGSGRAFDWSMIPDPQQRKMPLVLAGGLDEHNVGAAVRAVRPYAVDVSSGVEIAKGVKSADRIERFITAVRAADAGMS